MPDILLCGNWPLLLVSPRVIECWEQNEVTGYASYPARLFRKVNKELVEEDVCYKNIEITGRAELDFASMGVQVSFCSECGVKKFSKHMWEFGKTIYKSGSWDGSDLFVFKIFETNPVCGIKNLEIIYKNKRTKFRITKMEEAFNFGTGEDRVNLFSVK